MRTLHVLLIASAVVASACGASTVQPSPTPTATVTTQPSPTASTSLAPTALDHDVVYFARDRLPPVAAHVDRAGTGATAEARILSRLGALLTADAPAGLVNVAKTTKARPRAATVSADLVTVDFTVPGGEWGTAGSTGTRAYIQQLVYTATEEPGIRRVLILENGGQAIVGGEGVVIDHPAAREDVLGYTFRPSMDPVTLGDDRTGALVIGATLAFEDDVRALTRLTVTAGAATPKDLLGFTAKVVANDETARPELGKWALVVDVPKATTTDAGLTIVDRTPVRAMRASAQGTGVRYEIGLDDLRPWRAAMQYAPLRLVIDVGGDPMATSPNIALYAPAFGASVRAGSTLNGLVRAFEGRFEYRVRDAGGNVVVDDFATASLGTSELWGAFSVSLPSLPAGNATLELLLHSPKDGAVSESVSTAVVIAP